jgi:hypothetical protein
LDASLQTHYPQYFNKGDGGLRNIYKALVENEKYWNNLLYAVAEGMPSEIDRLCRFDVFEFFSFLSNYEAKVNAMKKRADEAKRKKK